MQARRAAARRGVQIHLAGYLAMVVIVLTVWLAVGLTAGAWYFWPVWPILGAGIGVLGHALPIRFAMPAVRVSAHSERPQLSSGAQRVGGSSASGQSAHAT